MLIICLCHSPASWHIMLKRIRWAKFYLWPWVNSLVDPNVFICVALTPSQSLLCSVFSSCSRHKWNCCSSRNYVCGQVSPEVSLLHPLYTSPTFLSLCSVVPANTSYLLFALSSATVVLLLLLKRRTFNLHSLLLAFCDSMKPPTLVSLGSPAKNSISSRLLVRVLRIGPGTFKSSSLSPPSCHPRGLSFLH